MKQPKSHLGTAGSKVILLGEHAVVHGNDALVLGLPKGVVVTAMERNGVEGTAQDGTTQHHPALSLQFTSWQLDAPSLVALNDALTQLLQGLTVAPNAVSLSVQGNIPARAGMGASASLGMACARAVNGLFQLHKTDAELYDAVLAFENRFHQNASGVDIHAVAHPGCAIFNKKLGLRSLATAEVPIMVVHSGEPGATKDTVPRFAQHLNSNRSGASLLAQMQQIVTEGRTALEAAQWQQLGRLMNENHSLLQRFGVSSKKLDDICRIAANHGALGAKMTGGGGGGCAVVLLEAACPAAVKSILRQTFRKNDFEVVYECMM